jgi:hypothetical protein
MNATKNLLTNLRAFWAAAFLDLLPLGDIITIIDGNQKDLLVKGDIATHNYDAF